MTANTDTPRGPTIIGKFASKALYKKLIEILPLYVQDPFAEMPTLNIDRLRIKLRKKSKEAIYKWLRKDHLSPKNAAKLITLAQQQDNQEVLVLLDRKVPELQDLYPFVFVA